MGISFGTWHGGVCIHSFILAISVTKRDLTVNLMHIFGIRQNPFSIPGSLNSTTNKAMPEKTSCPPLCTGTPAPRANPLISAFKRSDSAMLESGQVSPALLTSRAADGPLIFDQDSKMLSLKDGAQSQPSTAAAQDLLSGLN